MKKVFWELITKSPSKIYTQILGGLDMELRIDLTKIYRQKLQQSILNIALHPDNLNRYPNIN